MRGAAREGSRVRAGLVGYGQDFGLHPEGGREANLSSLWALSWGRRQGVAWVLPLSLPFHPQVRSLEAHMYPEKLKVIAQQVQLQQQQEQVRLLHQEKLEREQQHLRTQVSRRCLEGQFGPGPGPGLSDSMLVPLGV